MKIIALLFLFNFQVAASVYSQRISLTASNTPLRDVLQSIRKQSGYSFFVESDNLRDSKPVNLDLTEASITAALEKVFENQPFSYTIENKVIVVTRKRDNLSAADFLTFNNGGPDSLKVVHIQGKVKDDKGQPLVGVSIRVKGGSVGTVTNADGNYILKTNAAATLIFSYIGYLTKEIKASQGDIDVVLQQLNTSLDQVQVIAYGTTTKRTSTGSIATVTAETIERQPVLNPLLALEGRVAGLFIQQKNGIPGSSPIVSIQGTNSLQKGTAPFYVVDGVPYSAQSLSPNLSFVLAGGASPLSYINPNDIESITVLKDADATAIYGSRAANGAILITTKKGKSGMARVNFDLQTGWSKAPRRLHLMDTKDYIALRLEGKKNDNSPITATDYDINGTWDSTRNTDWQKELIGKTAGFTNLQVSCSGGSPNTQFLVGGGYAKETTVFPGDLNNSKANAHININHYNKKLKLNIAATYLQDNTTLPLVDLMSTSLSLPPNAPALYNGDGTLNWAPIANTNMYSFSGVYLNPLAFLLRKYKGSSNNLIGNADITYSLLPGLEVKSTFGYNYLQTNETSITPQASFSPNLMTVNLRNAKNADKSISSWISEPQISYRKDFAFGNFAILAGSSFQQVKSYALAITGTGFANDAQLGNLQSAPVLSIPTLLQSTYRYNAIFSRINYNYHNKYLLTLAGRRDGSSRFGPANRFANFYSIAGAWVFTDENFIKNTLNFLSFGKLRLSYGTTGNDQIGDYQYLTLYNNIPTNIPYQQTVGIQPSGHSNPNLQWELTKKANIGIDLGILNNRIILNANYYRNRSNNQLIYYPLGYLTGFASINRNVNATIQNSGTELQIEASLIKTSKIQWNTNLNFTINRNKLLRFDDLKNTTLANLYVVGQPINIQKVYPFVGVNNQTGLYEYLTIDGKKTSAPNLATDRTKLVDINPKYYGGFTNEISVKRFTINIFFQFVKQTGISSKMTLTGTVPGQMANIPTIIDNNRWKSPGDNAIYQKASTTADSYTAYNALFSSEAQYADASFIRLKNASITYELDPKWLQTIKISSMRLFIQGQNLFTITNYFGIDPESQNINSIPPLRTITIGAHIDL
ncbi:SusC/RagA family TonB-linked outer membrane protein [Chitinophaga flava]|nr:SusC/RagA family TonB-linked outer membrane protein [Chitinophaga flava]